MKKHIATLVSLLLVLGLGACIKAVTESFPYDVLVENGLSYIDLDGQDDRIEPIDLTTDDDFAEYQSKIHTVERVSFVTDLFTKDDADAIVDISFRRDSTQPWVLLLKGATVPGTSSPFAQHTIEYAASEKLIQNFDQFQTVAEGGVMDLLLEARDGNDQVRITRLILWVTINADAI